MGDPLDPPPEVMEEFTAALEDWAAAWLEEAEAKFNAWEDSVDGTQIVMVVPDEEEDTDE